MHLSDDIVFNIGEIETYAYVFQNTNKEFQTEYIHCIILEILDDENNDNPKRILVKQIHNLETYLSGLNSYDHFSERILNTKMITKLIGTKR